MENDYDEVFEFIDNVDSLGEYGVFSDPIPAIPHQRNMYLRDIKDPFECYDDREFKNRYRFRKETVRNVIIPLVEVVDDSLTSRGLPNKIELQVLIALRFFATGSIQVVVGDLHFISQPTICRIVKSISRKLANLVDRYVKFPENLQTVAEGFENMSHHYPGLRHIIGAIDCSHVKIKRPRAIEHSEAYRNRKGYFSINVQAIVGPDLKIYDIVARWPGSAHDSRVFRSSRVHARLESGELQGILVGDSGYRSTTYMLTPYRNPATPGQNRYNYVQVRTRNIVERFFGVWKKRFACLQVGLANKLRTTSNIIISCAVLHNLGIETNDNLDGIDLETVSTTDESVPHVVASIQSPSGLAFRNNIVSQYYD